MPALFVIMVLIIVVPTAMLVVGALLSGPGYKGPVSDHFNGSKFINPGGVKAKGGLELLQWMINRKPGRWMKELSAAYGQHPLGHFRDGIRVTFVNHSTFLIQVDGINILTDPVWSER